MTIRRWICIATLAFSATAAFAYEDLDDLLDDLQKKQATALREYIAQHPDAEDVAEAEDRLSYSLVLMGEYDEASKLLLRKYEAAIKADETDMEQLFGMIVVPLVQTYIQGGRIAEGRDLLERVKKDLGSRAEDPDVAGAIEQLAEGLKLPSVGDKVEIAFTALDGTEIDVGRMTDKVVLIDYWATWCMPCMQELPSVKALYKDYREKGFEIVGISLDEDREALERVIKDRGITWPQAFDGAAWDTELATKYGIQSIPTTFLIGRDGKVAALNLRGDSLRAKVAELIGVEQKKTE